jgi:hypothetical protein
MTGTQQARSVNPLPGYRPGGVPNRCAEDRHGGESPPGQGPGPGGTEAILTERDTIRAAAASTRSPPVTVLVSYRDRAVLRAVADGRAAVSGDCGHPLIIDGVCCADQFAGTRLSRAGLIATIGSAPARAVLTETGRAVLAA